MSCNTVVVQQKGHAKVTIGGVSGHAVVLSQDVVARIDAHRPVRARSSITPVSVIEKDTPVKMGGLGPQGVPGAPGGSIAPINFTYGDPSRVVYTAARPGLLRYVVVVIETPFNGTGPAIALGNSGDHDAAFPASFNNPADAGNEYEHAPDLRMAIGDTVSLYITPGAGATAGAGYALLTFLPD